MTNVNYLPVAWDAPLSAYEVQAEELLAAHAAGIPIAIKLFHENHPRFLDDVVTWKPKDLNDDVIPNATLTLDDARIAIARVYSFRDWNALTQLVNAVQDPSSPAREFEQAVQAVITGDVPTLRTMLQINSALVHARSTRITCHDKPQHRATLLHYLGANGVENHRQCSPANAVDVARLLLDTGAEVDALAEMYGSGCTTLSMLVSSTPPADAGVQVPLVHVLVDFGANVEGAGTGSWVSPLMTALVFGFRDAANALVERGAQVDTLVKAAGVGQLAGVLRLVPDASQAERHQALALAGIMANLDVVRFLLELGEDPNRLNPDGFHSHGTPLHHAAGSGVLELVKLLLAHGARTDIADTLWNGTPWGWAEHGGQTHVLEYMQSLLDSNPS